MYHAIHDKTVDKFALPSFHQVKRTHTVDLKIGWKKVQIILTLTMRRRGDEMEEHVDWEIRY